MSDAIERIVEATGFMPQAAAFAFGYCDGVEADAVAFLWEVAGSGGEGNGTPEAPGGTPEEERQ